MPPLGFHLDVLESSVDEIELLPCEEKGVGLILDDPVLGLPPHLPGLLFIPLHDGLVIQAVELRVGIGNKVGYCKKEVDLLVTGALANS